MAEVPADMPSGSCFFVQVNAHLKKKKKKERLVEIELGGICGIQI